jgi:hypothetical protein
MPTTDELADHIIRVAADPARLAAEAARGADTPFTIAQSNCTADRRHRQSDYPKRRGPGLDRRHRQAAVAEGEKKSALESHGAGPALQVTPGLFP